MAFKNLRQWAAWWQDPRCIRPAVTCQKCDTHYPRGKDTGNSIFNGYTLIECGACQEVKFSENVVVDEIPFE